MMQRPWELAPADEWLPRQLRLTFGGPGDGDSGPGGGSDGGGFQSSDSSSFFGDSAFSDPGSFQSTDSSQSFSSDGGGFQSTDGGGFQSTDGGGFQSTSSGYSDSGGGYTGGDSYSGSYQGSDTGGGYTAYTGTDGGYLGGDTGGGYLGGSSLGGNVAADAAYGGSTAGGGPFGGGGPGGFQTSSGFNDSTTGQGFGLFGQNQQGDLPAGTLDALTNANAMPTITGTAPYQGALSGPDVMAGGRGPDLASQLGINDLSQQNATVNAQLNDAITQSQDQTQAQQQANQTGDQLASDIAAALGRDTTGVNQFQTITAPLDLTSPMAPAYAPYSPGESLFGPPTQTNANMSRSGMDMEFNPFSGFQAPTQENQGTQGLQGGRSDAPSLMDMLNPVSTANAQNLTPTDLLSSTQFNQSLNELGQQYGRDAAALDQLSRGMDQYYADSRAAAEALQGPQQPNTAGKGDFQGPYGRGGATFNYDFAQNFNPNNLQPSLDYALPRGDLTPADLNIYQAQQMAQGNPQFSGQPSLGQANATPGRGDAPYGGPFGGPDVVGDRSQPISLQEARGGIDQAMVQDAYNQAAGREGESTRTADQQQPQNTFDSRFGDQQQQSQQQTMPSWMNPGELMAGVRGGQELFAQAPQNVQQALQAGNPYGQMQYAATPWGTTFAQPTAPPGWMPSQQYGENTGVRGNEETLARSQTPLQDMLFNPQTVQDRQAAIERLTPDDRSVPVYDFRINQDVPLPRANPLDVDVRTDPTTRTQTRTDEQQQSRQSRQTEDTRPTARVTVNPERSGPPLQSRGAPTQTQSRSSNQAFQQASRGDRSGLDALLTQARTAPTLAGRIAALDQLNGIISAMRAAGLPNPYGRDPDPGVNAALRMGR